MKEEKKEKLKLKLIEAGYMTQEETLIDVFQASYVDRLVGSMGTWKRGWAYFTEEKLIVLSGLGFHHAIVIPYRNIRELRKCTQSLFPMGIKITYEDTEKNTLVTEKISMMKRNKWMDFMAKKAGI